VSSTSNGYTHVFGVVQLRGTTYNTATFDEYQYLGVSWMKPEVLVSQHWKNTYLLLQWSPMFSGRQPKWTTDNMVWCRLTFGSSRTSGLIADILVFSHRKISDYIVSYYVQLGIPKIARIVIRIVLICCFSAEIQALTISFQTDGGTDVSQRWTVLSTVPVPFSSPTSKT
jgi:hypothetical protein